MPPSLKRELTTFSAMALVVANMIGTGIFTTTGFLAGDLGRSPLVLGIWVVGGVVAVAGCLVYSELGINLPRSGGEYVYLREAWGPVWGFVSGWVSFFAGFSAPIAAGGLAFAAYLSYFYPSLSPSSSDALLHSGVGWIHLGNGQLLAIGVIVVFAVVNILGLGHALFEGIGGVVCFQSLHHLILELGVDPCVDDPFGLTVEFDRIFFGEELIEGL